MSESIGRLLHKAIIIIIISLAISSQKSIQFKNRRRQQVVFITTPSIMSAVAAVSENMWPKMAEWLKGDTNEIQVTHHDVFLTTDSRVVIHSAFTLAFVFHSVLQTISTCITSHIIVV